MDIKRVAVIGGGVMGRQIALNTALSGVDTYITDAIPATVEQLGPWAGEYAAGRVQKGKLTQEAAQAALDKFHPVADVADAVRGADLVIEAIIEDKAIKTKLYQDLDALVRPDTILASNSSFMPSSWFADVVSHPERMANLHYFNPALVMQLVEVVQGPHTSDATAAALMDFAQQTCKYPIRVRKEVEGFVANRIAKAVTREALWMLDEGVATAEEIDAAAEKGLGYPMGPFKLQDLAGIDIAYLTAKRGYEETGEKSPGYDRLEEKYNAHEWGRKTGKGWYDYTKK